MKQLSNSRIKKTVFTVLFILIFSAGFIGAASAASTISIAGISGSVNEGTSHNLNLILDVSPYVINDAAIIDGAVTSSNQTVGIVSSGAFHALVPGTTALTALYGCVTSTLDVIVTVVPSAADYIDIMPKSTTVKNGSSPVQFSASAWNISKGRQVAETFTWSSDNAGTINPSTGLFTPDKAGTYTITATASGSSLTNTTTINVTDPDLTTVSVAIASGSSTPQAGQSFSIYASGLDEDGEAFALTDASINWTYDDSILEETGTTSSGTQQFTARSEGSTEVKATQNGVTSSGISIIVSNTPVAPVISISGAASALVNDTKTYTVSQTGGVAINTYQWTVTPEYGAVITGNTTSLPSVEFSESGTFSVGVRVTNTSTTLSGIATYTVTVTTPTPPSPPSPVSPVSPYSGGSTDTGSGNYNEYDRSVSNGGFVSFGTSPTVTGMELPAGTTGEVKLVVTSSESAPEGKKTLKVFEITAPAFSGTAKIYFKISSSEFASGFGNSDVCLYHKSGSKWESLKTYLVKNENGVSTYYAETTSTSPFAIIFEKDAADTSLQGTVTVPTPEETISPVPSAVASQSPSTAVPSAQPTSSPAPLLGLIAALGAVVMLRKW